MGGILLRRRAHRRHPYGFPGRERIRPVGFKPADHVARLRAAASKGAGAEALTLDDVVADAWRALSESETAQCPLCAGEMQRGAEGGRLHGHRRTTKGSAWTAERGSRRGFTAGAQRAKLKHAGQAAAEVASEESPDITGQGGRAIDPGKPAGKCHRNKPPTLAVPRERPAGKGEMVR